MCVCGGGGVSVCPSVRPSVCLNPNVNPNPNPNPYFQADKVDILIKAAGEKVTAAKRKEIMDFCDPRGSGNLQVFVRARVCVCVGGDGG